MGPERKPDAPPERLAAEDFARHTQLSMEHEARYRFAAQLVAGKRVLDVGCGEGIFLDIARKSGAAELFGLDSSTDALERVKARLTDFPGLHLNQGRAETLPFADRSFDVVSILEVIEHLDHPDAAIAECRRVVKLDGMVVVSVPNDELNAQDNPHHKHRFTHNRLLGLMRQHFPHVRLFRLVTYAGATILPFGHDEISLRLPDLEHRGWAAVGSMRKLGATSNAHTLAPLSAFEAESTGQLEKVVEHLATEIEGLKSDLRDLRQSAIYRLLHRLAREADRRDLHLPDWMLPEKFKERPGDGT